MKMFRFSRKQLCIPYALFLICFVVLPLAVIVYYAFTDGSGRFTLDNLISFFTNGNTIGTLCYSVVIAAVVTAVCLLIAYPVAYVLARSGLKRGPVILMLFIMPMWINFTLRITALKEILTLLEGNLSLHPFLNTVIGMTYDYLPFMILPIYNVMSKIDKDVIEAAQDLGATVFVTFRKIIVPLSLPGVISGVTMVFIPSMSEFVVADILGGSKILLLGNVIEQEFNLSNNWNLGSGLSIVLMVFILISMAVMNRSKAEEGDTMLW